MQSSRCKWLLEEKRPRDVWRKLRKNLVWQKGSWSGLCSHLVFFVWKVRGDAEIKVFRIAAFLTQEIFVQLLLWIAAFASCSDEVFSALLEGHN